MPIEPFKSEILQLADGSGIYWEASGNPKGKPSLYLHGGPGSGLQTGHRQLFDPGLDVSGPLRTAWRLHRCWSKSRLIVVETEGHGGAAMWNEFTKAIAGFLPVSP